MSEKTYTHHRHERDKPNHEIEDHNQEILSELAEKGRESQAAHEATKDEKLEAFRNEAQNEALKADDLLAQHSMEEKREEPTHSVGKDLKDLKFARTMQSVRKDLSKPERTFSKVVHNRIVDSVSNSAEKTIARPSGLLFGSIFAFVGSSVFLYAARHYGFQYNYLIMVLCFGGGFVLGLLVESLYRMVKKSPRA